MIKVILNILFFLHFFFTANYLLPTNPLSKKIASFTNLYMNPIFHQNWELFGRNLVKSTPSITYKCSPEDDWFLLGHNILRKHQDTRIIGLGKLYYLVNFNIREAHKHYINLNKIEKDHAKIQQNLLNQPNMKKILSHISRICKRDFITVGLALIRQRNLSEIEEPDPHELIVIEKYENVQVIRNP